MSKKVAFIYQGAKYYGGIETYLEQLFLGFDTEKIEPILISLNSWELGTRLKNHGFSVIEMPSRWYNPFQILTLLKEMKKNGISLIVSQGMVSNFYGRLVSLFLGIPNIVTIHSDYKFDFRGYKKYLFWLSFVILNPITKKFIVVSKFLQDEARKLLIPEEKIEVIYNGLLDTGIQSKPIGEEIVVGSLGRLHHKKGYHNLIKAVHLLGDLHIVVKIWGEGDEREALEGLIKKYKLEKKVFLMGFTKDIKSALREIDIYIQPSLEEGFGLTVAEAMLAEKLVIVTPAGSLPELITDGETGFIAGGFGAEDLSVILRDSVCQKEKLGTIGKNAREEALKRFGISLWVKKITSAYLGVAK